MAEHIVVWADIPVTDMQRAMEFYATSPVCPSPGSRA